MDIRKIIKKFFFKQIFCKCSNFCSYAFYKKLEKCAHMKKNFFLKTIHYG
jgi:hypothetical protein